MMSKGICLNGRAMLLSHLQNRHASSGPCGSTILMLSPLCVARRTSTSLYAEAWGRTPWSAFLGDSPAL